MVGQRTRVTFLDEFRIVVLSDKQRTVGLVVFNTIIPQYHPGILRRLALPHETFAIIVDRDRPLGIMDVDEPLITDPTQAILVVEPVNNLDPPVVVTMQALVGQTHPTCADSLIPWNEWGRDAVIMEILLLVHYSRLQTFVHDAQVVVAFTCSDSWDFPAYCCGVQTFDFSRRGCSSLLLRGGETRRGAPIGGEDSFRFGPGGPMIPRRGLGSLSDGSLFYLVGRFSKSTGSNLIG